MLCGGTDSMINPLGVGGFCKLRALSTRNDQPESASRPFDVDRDGFVLGEGAGILVLERLDDALSRGAAIDAEVVGYGSSLDAHGISEPHPEGRGAMESMRRAILDAGADTGSVDCINAHGSSTPKNDVMETLAIRRLFGDRSTEIPVVSTKSMIGHLIAASGAVEMIAAILCLKRQTVHPTINLQRRDPDCNLDYVPGASRPHVHESVLCNSFGFGGQNASVLLRRWCD
jgi:3-oxoacyl-[acyl-carrier-protein] synthase II